GPWLIGMQRRWGVPAMTAPCPDPRTRAQDLLCHEVRSVHERTNRLFSWLLMAQWLAGLACALWISPLAWSGVRSSTHPHVLAATVVVGVYHLVRGLWSPQSVFGPGAAANWRWAEHAGWVLFEDSCLIPSCLRGLSEMTAIADRQAQLEQSKAATEDEVRAR